MSRVDELIAELCPWGVKFKPLGECISANRGGGTPSRARPDFWDGQIPWASVGDLSISENVIRTTRAHISESGLLGSSSSVISAGDVVVAVKISPGRMKVAGLDLAINQDLRGLALRDTLDAHFLAYYFQTLKLVGDGTIVRAITSATLERIEVPVPPLEVQREVVRILDTFTELEAELEARRRQYVHYRSDILRQPSVDSPTIASLTRGIAAGKNKSRSENGVYPVFGSTGQIGWTDDPPHDEPALLIARVGANAGRVSSVSGRYDVTDNTLIVRPTPAWDLRFAYHQLTAMNLNQHAVGGGQPLLTGSLVKSLEVWLPPADRQREIATILDSFDALVNDLSVGLPAELAARRRQYEYYRDKLLTFKELPA